MSNGILENINRQRFDKIREQRLFYIDKTEFIKEWWEEGSFATLITRPHGFGKTLNMSMVECFFSNKYENRNDLFEGLSIWNEKSHDGEYKYRKLQGTYPVISLSLASAKSGTVEELKTAVKEIIADEYRKYEDIMKADCFDDHDRKIFAAIMGGMEDDMVCMSINRLCGYLARYYHKDAIVLLDEYDAPLMESWLAGTLDGVAGFLEELLIPTFKANDHLCRGILAGVTRIPKGGIFSGLNNLDVVTTSSGSYAASFGFTEEEASEALDSVGLGGEKQDVKQWYGGFAFGWHTDVYNPHSIVSFIKSGGIYDTYQADTDWYGLANNLIQRGNREIKQTMEELLKGNSFITQIDEQIAFNQLNDGAETVWSLLLASGYLKIANLDRTNTAMTGDVWYTLALTNLEVRKMFEKMIRDWFGNIEYGSYGHFMKALLAGDRKAMNRYMSKIMSETFSSFDTENQPFGYAEPERFYHGFVLSLMVEIVDRYAIISNPESGFWCYDVMLEPLSKADDAIIIEFREYDPEDEETLADTVRVALQQIEEKHYDAALEAKGIAPERFRKYGFAFRGDECLVG